MCLWNHLFYYIYMEIYRKYNKIKTNNLNIFVLNIVLIFAI